MVTEGRSSLSPFGHPLNFPVHALLGQAYLAGGYLQESEQTLARAAKQAGETKDHLYPHVLSLQSSVYAAMHNLPQVIQLQQESLLALDEVSGQDIFFQAEIYTSLGQYYSHLGQFEDDFVLLTNTSKSLLALLKKARIPQKLTVYPHKALAHWYPKILAH